jgi:hypothetical protein
VKVLTKLKDFEAINTLPTQMQVYVLSWLIHLAGDLHQPLHTVALFRSDLPDGDRGGNDIQMKGGGNLHTFWDGRVGTSVSDNFIAQTVTTITTRHPKPTQINIDPAVWVQDSVDQRFFVYSFSGMGTTQDKAVLSRNYATNSKLLAFERAALVTGWRNFSIRSFHDSRLIGCVCREIRREYVQENVNTRAAGLLEASTRQARCSLQ